MWTSSAGFLKEFESLRIPYRLSIILKSPSSDMNVKFRVKSNSVGRRSNRGEGHHELRGFTTFGRHAFSWKTVHGISVKFSKTAEQSTSGKYEWVTGFDDYSDQLDELVNPFSESV